MGSETMPPIRFKRNLRRNVEMSRKRVRLVICENLAMFSGSSWPKKRMVTPAGNSAVLGTVAFACPDGPHPQSYTRLATRTRDDSGQVRLSGFDKTGQGRAGQSRRGTADEAQRFFEREDRQLSRFAVRRAIAVPPKRDGPQQRGDLAPRRLLVDADLRRQSRGLPFERFRPPTIKRVDVVPHRGRHRQDER